MGEMSNYVCIMEKPGNENNWGRAIIEREIKVHIQNLRPCFKTSFLLDVTSIL